MFRNNLKILTLGLVIGVLVVGVWAGLRELGIGLVVLTVAINQEPPLLPDHTRADFNIQVQVTKLSKISLFLPLTPSLLLTI